MAEETVKIVVEQEARGDAIKKAAEDVQKLADAQEKAKEASDKAAQHPAPKPTRADREYNREMNEAARAAVNRTVPDKAAERQARAAELRAQREEKQAILATKLEAQAAHAGGDPAEGRRLEREARVLDRASTIRRTLGVEPGAARTMAEQAIGGEEAKSGARAEAKQASKDERDARAEELRAKRAEAQTKKQEERAAAQEKRNEGKTAQQEERAEAKRGQKEERDAKAAALRKTREETLRKKEEERAEAKRKREEGAVETARASRLNRVGRAAESLAENASGGGGAIGGIMNALGAGSIPGMIAATVTAMTVGLVEGARQASLKRAIMGAEVDTERASQDRHLQRLGGFEGSSSAARDEAEAAQDEITRREADRRRLSLERDANFKFTNPATWEDRARGIDRIPYEKNEAEINLARERKVLATALKYKHLEEVTNPELKAQEARLNYRPREARDLEHMVLWRKEYNRLLKEGAQEWQAQEGAGNTVAEKQRAEWQKVAGALVNARSGSGDIARAARVATGEIGGGGGAVNALRQDMNRNHREAVNAHPHRF